MQRSGGWDFSTLFLVCSRDRPGSLERGGGNMMKFIIFLFQTPDLPQPPSPPKPVQPHSSTPRAAQSPPALSPSHPASSKLAAGYLHRGTSSPPLPLRLRFCLHAVAQRARILAPLPVPSASVRRGFEERGCCSMGRGCAGGRRRRMMMEMSSSRGLGRGVIVRRSDLGPGHRGRLLLGVMKMGFYLVLILIIRSSPFLPCA